MSTSSNGWFIAADDGQARGPFERSELLALRVAGQLADDALVWTLELAEWVPLRRALPPSTAAAAALLAAQSSVAKTVTLVAGSNTLALKIPAAVAASPPVTGDLRVPGAKREPASARSADPQKSNTAPNQQQRIALDAAAMKAVQTKTERFVWGLRRVLARNIDFAILGGLGWALLTLIVAKLGGSDLPAALPGFERLSILLVVFFGLLALPLEALLLGLSGYTPGKFVMGLRVVGRGNAGVGIARAFKRALQVFVRGQGLLIPPISLIANVIALQRLLTEGRTHWDQAFDTEVQYAPMSANRWWAGLALAALAYAALADDLYAKLLWALAF